MAKVARYEYAASLIVRKEWGTGSYGLPHSGRYVSAFTRGNLFRILENLEDGPAQFTLFMLISADFLLTFYSSCVL